MKKLLIMLFASLLLVACSDEGDTTKDTGEENNEKATDTDTSKKEEQKKVYQIGETAVITSDLYEFDYEVTVDDFKLTREVDGTPLDDIISGAEEDGRFAVVEVTIKNISDRSYVPNEMFSANFARMDAKGGETSYDQFFTIGDEELAPGEEIQGHLVYTTRVDYADTFVLKYEFMSDEETHFELPNPEQ
ncbi:MAG: DUF4352 domain-containing protein [Bacillota bacterium]|uniref:DUF4352 domain-containing protein n=1 Tax=Virgibacillus salarius TaxID=447199 RepID=A0A941DTG0_9BACI|nr:MULTISPECIES: DUF4352 domain-containing protein [Bacillaceae]NAZ09109.1 DUF4352 domain-containing protein [Agaribacter marinus]MBR7796400.1 DUF4352 domain-containing protein [Virgibacillus salarius]MCC2250985.1 DUF4352 domain-containing protein [Virgibacillus sp. AGTR]QRZ19733.1 DUF4352 domain-containing protein [Virgibacillus sp. AGTR]WBX80592.1 DUF4352 domain-containing protein [Virgibacillus salarius]